LIFSFVKEPDGKADSLFTNVAGKVRIADPKTAYLRLPASYFEPQTLLSILRKIFK